MKRQRKTSDPTEQNGGKKDSNSSIAWHPAFVEAIQMELDEYRDILEFYPEYQLTSEPLRIDCVVIKKVKDVQIEKNIASIFREIKLIEYKSPDDYISVDDFYKVYAYACLYASFEKIPVTRGNYKTSVLELLLTPKEKIAFRNNIKINRNVQFSPKACSKTN